MIAITYLGSGSEGNCALLEFGESHYLLDAGLSARKIRQFLTTRGIGLDSLNGIILTHDHGDHTRGLPQLLKTAAIPVLTTEQTRRALIHQGCSISQLVPFRPGQELERNGVRFHPFRLPHDAVDPIGVRAEWHGHSITIASDFGHVTPPLLEHLPGTDILCLESNYDPAMLRACSYPDWLKRRISGPRGHFPNSGVGTVLSKLNKELAHLVLVHLSRDSNTPSLAWQALVPSLSLPQLARCKITVADQHQITTRLSVGGAPVAVLALAIGSPAIQHRFDFDPQEHDSPCMSIS